MIRSLKRGLAGLVTFTGRTAPGDFWPYAITVFVVCCAAMAFSFVPAFASTFDRMQRFAEAHPDQATVTRTATSYSISIQGAHPELMPDFSGLVPSIGVGVIVLVILLAAVVARRLDDRGSTALWGLLPLPFLAIGLVGMQQLFPRFASPDGPPIPLFLGLFANNLLYLVALAVLVMKLGGASAAEANRYGPPPTL